jgi:ABC-type antimicrobial peptide transport system permease subunit
LAVISESTARAFWPTEDALGKSFALNLDWRSEKLDRFDVIGIVKDVRFFNLTRLDPSHVYLPAGMDWQGRSALLVRIQGDRSRAFAAIGSVVEASGRDLLPSLQVFSLDDAAIQLQRTLSRLFAILAATLASLALTLAGVGIYGVIAYLVSQRTREIGIRMALGAGAGDVWKGVVLHGLRPVLIGMFLGLAAAAGISVALHRTLIFPGSMDFLYGVPFYDPVTFIGITCFVLAVAALASMVPARRALRVDPSVALRYE